MTLAACTSQPGVDGAAGSPPKPAAASSHAAQPGSPRAIHPRSPVASRPAGEFTISFAGDVHFSGRVRLRLDHDPATVFAQAEPEL